MQTQGDLRQLTNWLDSIGLPLPKLVMLIYPFLKNEQLGLPKPLVELTSTQAVHWF